MENVIGETDNPEKIIIDRSYRNELIFELSNYGINKYTLFPDSDLCPY